METNVLGIMTRAEEEQEESKNQEVDPLRAQTKAEREHPVLVLDHEASHTASAEDHQEDHLGDHLKDRPEAPEVTDRDRVRGVIPELRVELEVVASHPGREVIINLQEANPHQESLMRNHVVII